MSQDKSSPIVDAQRTPAFPPVHLRGTPNRDMESLSTENRAMVSRNTAIRAMPRDAILVMLSLSTAIPGMVREIHAIRA